MDLFLDVNLRNWDERAALHATDATGSYRIETVLAGGSCLHAIEAAGIGDVSNKDIVHLQCHIGLDTLSLKHLGARSVTGLDFSPRALAAARDFAMRAGTKARFVEASLYDAPAALGATYDMVFVTWGAINWLPDIDAWAKVVADVLKPGGTLYLAEGHPLMNQMEVENGRLYLAFDRATPTDAPLAFDEATTYTGDARPLRQTRTYEWLHPLGSILSALLKAGLCIQAFEEHDVIPWRAFAHMVPVGEGLYALPTEARRCPLAFSLRARKSA